MISYRFISILLLISLFLQLVSAQCCSDLENAPSDIGGVLTIEEKDIWSGDVVLESDLVVRSELVLENCDLTMMNTTILVEEQGVLNCSGSEIHYGGDGAGFYIDSRGPLSFSECKIIGCLDEKNGYFGLYSSGSSLEIVNTTFEMSGSIRCEKGSVSVFGSDIPGIVIAGANAGIYGSRISGTGISSVGPGEVIVHDTEVTSNLTFEHAAAISAVTPDRLEVRNVTIGGSFLSGIYCFSGYASISDLEVGLDHGEYGVYLENSSIEEIEGLHLQDCDTGLAVIDCLGDVEIESSTISNSYTGIRSTGPAPVSIEGVEINSSAYGIRSGSPLDVTGSSFETVIVGTISEGDTYLGISDCRFSNYTTLGILQETWEQVTYGSNTYRPANGSVGEIGWMGSVDVQVIGQNGLEMNAATLLIRSELEQWFTAEPGKVEMIWGYQNGSFSATGLEYTLHSEWGNSRTERTMIVEEGASIVMVLNLTDLSVVELNVEDGKALVTLGCNGSLANEVNVEILVDGRFWTDERVSMDSGEMREVEIVLGDIPSGEHTITARVSSQEEYGGMSGALLRNNEMSIDIEVDDEDGGDDEEDLIVPLLIIGSSVLLILVTFCLRRSD